MSQFEKSLVFYLSKGNLEILKFLENKNLPVQFKVLREIVNPKTNKKYSSSTVAASIRDLELKGAIRNEIIRQNKRKSVGYKLTNCGQNTLNILKEAEEKLQKNEGKL